MLNLKSRVKICDKTSTTKGICIKILRNKSFASLGDCFLLSVRVRNVKRASFLKVRLQKKFSIGSIQRAVLLRSKKNFLRYPGLFIKFSENACALVNRRVVPISNRIYGPILKEFCMIWPSIGCVSKDIF